MIQTERDRSLSRSTYHSRIFHDKSEHIEIFPGCCPPGRRAVRGEWFWDSVLARLILANQTSQPARYSRFT
jgi:hypothetical protein